MEVADQAVSMGALWCTITGGEPLLRDDFKDIYLGLKKKGLLVSVYTNATLIRKDHIELFKMYPPQDIEITVYGITKETYETVTRRRGSYQAFMQGLGMLLDNGFRVRLKAMALRSNIHELPQISAFCRVHTCDYFRFDPLLHLRLDGDSVRNKEIKLERLTPQEIVALERGDPERFNAMEKGCDKLINPEFCKIKSDYLFQCGTGVGSFVLGYDCLLRLCISLNHPDCVDDLRKGNLASAWQSLVPKVQNTSFSRHES